MPSIAKAKLLSKKYRKHLFSSFQKTKLTQTGGSVFAEGIEKVKKTKFELDLIKIVDCFLNGHGNYDSNLVSFKIKSFQTEIQRDLHKSIGSANDIVNTPIENPSAVKNATKKKIVANVRQAHIKHS